MVPKPTYKRMLIGFPGLIYMSDVECILYTYTVEIEIINVLYLAILLVPFLGW